MSEKEMLSEERCSVKRDFSEKKCASLSFELWKELCEIKQEGP